MPPAPAICPPNDGLVWWISGERFLLLMPGPKRHLVLPRNPKVLPKGCIIGVRHPKIEMGYSKNTDLYLYIFNTPGTPIAQKTGVFLNVFFPKKWLNSKFSSNPYHFFYLISVFSLWNFETVKILLAIPLKQKSRVGKALAKRHSLPLRCLSWLE